MTLQGHSQGGINEKQEDTNYYFNSSSAVFSPWAALDHLYPAKVERVVDGDTIIVSLSLGLDVVLEHQWIRLFDINAWEPRGEEKEKGLEATKYLEERLKEGNIEIEIRSEWGQNGKGNFGRWLGVLYVDGVDINAEMMEKGHAEKYEEGEI